MALARVRPETRRQWVRLRATQREVASLAWPIAAAMLGETAMGLVDTKLVGGLGAAALGGVGVAATLMYLNYAVVFGLMRGVKVRTAHAVGEGRAEVARSYAHAGMALGLGAGVFVWLIARDATWALEGLGVERAMVPYARDFLAARTYGAPAICVLSALIQYRQGLGDTRTPMLVGLGGNVVNAALAYGLIYGRFGLPALGVRGAGYGTAIAEWLEVAAMLAFVLRGARASERAAGALLSLRRAAAEVCSLGVPTGLQFGLEMLAFTAFTAILGGMGAEQVAAHQVAMAVIRVSFLPGVAVAEAASVLVGRALGQRRLATAHRVTLASLGLAAGFMSLCGVGFALFGGAIARGFTPDAAVAAVAARLLLLAAVFQTLDAVTIVLRGVLRSAKDVRMVAAIGIAVAWVSIPGAALLLGRYAGMGALGGWCGFILETTVASALFWRRWTRGAWRARYAPAASTDTARGAVAPEAYAAA